MGDDAVREVEITIPDDDYDITVRVGAARIKRELRNVEERHPEEYALNGPDGLNLSRFATVDVEPTGEKWRDLARTLSGEVPD